MELVKEAINRTGYSDKIKIAIDVAATNFCIGKYYTSLQTGLPRLLLKFQSWMVLV